MKTYLRCIPCFIRQALEAASFVGAGEAESARIMRLVLERAAGLDFSMPPPAMGAEIHRIVRAASGAADPYARAKAELTRAALALLPGLMKRAASAADPFDAAVRIAIAGNIIDFSVVSSIDSRGMERTVEDALARPFAKGDSRVLHAAIRDSKRILFLADNAAEVVFDRVLLSMLPLDRVTIAVRGAPVINDATIGDAEAAGLPGMARVVGNGSDVPGTMLEKCSAEFRELFRKSDLVISKGQGNYETLSDSTERIFFLLKAKCETICEDLGCRMGDILIHSCADEHPI